MAGTQGIAVAAAPADDDPAAPMGAADATSTTPRWGRAQAFSLLFLLLLALPLVPSYYQWKHFRQDLNMLAPRAWTFGDVPLVWLYYAKTQLVLLPALALAALLIWRRWWRSGIVLFLLCVAAVIAWVEIDQRVYTLTNVHALAYLDFLGDPAATQWGGNPWDNVPDAARGLKKYYILSAIGTAGIFAFVALSIRLRPRLVGRRAAWVFATMYALSLVGVAPAQWTFRDRRSLQRAHAALPFDMTWTAPGAGLVDTSAFAVPFNQALAPGLKQHLSVLFNRPVQDTSARFTSGPRPSVLLMIVESLREDALTDEVMPQLTALSRRGMRFNQHFAAARYSHLGLYNLLFGRTSAIYYIMLRGTTTPQACVTLKNSGYQCNYTASADHLTWVRMGRFINDETFDQMNLFHAKSWVTRDQRTLARIKEILTTAAPDKPQFVAAFPASTHYPYTCPNEFRIFKPALPDDFRPGHLKTSEDIKKLRNRYMNSCHFMDMQIGELIRQIDLSKTLVIVTGDHGESLLDDGSIAHGGRWSNSQLRVPCFFVGAGVQPRVIQEPTTHMDILPTMLHVCAGEHVPISTITGRDVLSEEAAPEFQVIGADSLKDRFELLMRHKDRRMLFGFSITRYEAQVRGSVDAMGEINPYDLPPASEAPAWAAGVERIFSRLTGSEKTPLSH